MRDYRIDYFPGNKVKIEIDGEKFVVVFDNGTVISMFGEAVSPDGFDREAYALKLFSGKTDEQ